MNKHNILTITLIISGLALNQVSANPIQNSFVPSEITQQSISINIASHLCSRGIDKDVAEEMASNLLNEEDEILLAMFIQNLEVLNIVKVEEVLEFLSSAALHKQKIDFHSYDNMLGMVTKIKQASLDESTKRQLSQLVKINKQLFV